MEPALGLNGLNEAKRLNPSIGLRASSWNGWNWLFACVKCVFMDSQEIGNDLDDLVHSRKEEAGLKQQIDKLGETLRRGRKRKYQSL